MKLILVVIATLGFANALPAQRGVSEVWQEVQDLLPIDDIKALAVDYYNAGAFNKALNVIHSQDWAALVEKYQGHEYVQRMVTYLKENTELDLAALWETGKSYAARLPTATGSDATKTVSEFLADLKAILPLSEIKAYWQDKKASSEWLQNLIEKMSTEEFHQLVANAAATDVAQKVVQYCRDNGWPVDEYVEKVKAWFGW